jgi:hypothetical protein
MYRVPRRKTVIMSIVASRGMSGSVFWGIITSSISLRESMGLTMISADVIAERKKPIIKRPLFPFKYLQSHPTWDI